MSKTTNEINWREDKTFASFGLPLATDEFKAWWANSFGAPPVDWWADSARDIYWARCGFALMGWLGGRQQILEATNRE